MGKYEALGRFLKRKKKETTVELNFEEIEAILGFDLPRSARKYHPWWANDETHSHAVDGWLRSGWKTANTNIPREIVEFIRTETGGSGISVNDGDDEVPKITADITPHRFEEISRKVMSKYFGVEELSPRTIEGVPKLFDLVAPDGNTVGDAKFYSMVRGENIPPAKFSGIAEYVWFLEKLDAHRKFLVFGNDVRVPESWLDRYGDLNTEVEFYFIEENGDVKKLN